MENISQKRKKERTRICEVDLAVIGGGMAGTSAAVTAARLGLKTVLIQNRPSPGLRVPVNPPPWRP